MKIFRKFSDKLHRRDRHSDDRAKAQPVPQKGNSEVVSESGIAGPGPESRPKATTTTTDVLPPSTSTPNPKATDLEQHEKADNAGFPSDVIEKPNDSCKDCPQQDDAESPKDAEPEDAVIEDNKKADEPDLWKRAFERLNDDCKENLQEDKYTSPEKAIGEVIDKTKNNFETYKNSGLRFKKADGKEVNLRDVAKKILNSAVHCSEIIKGIAAFDPTGHASSAWTIISLGLTMTKNHWDQRDAIFASSEYLADTLARYTILEKLYRNGHPGLQDAIVGVYQAILEYTSEVKKRYNESKARGISNSIFSKSDTELAKLESAVAQKDQTVRDWSAVQNTLSQTKTSEEMLAGIEKIKIQIDWLQNERILKWLSDTQYSNIQDANQQLRTDETGSWLLDSEEYSQWKATPGKILWLHGPAGCGKSILCSTVIKDLTDKCDVDTTKTCTYWYFRFDRNETQNVKNMTRSIIRQLAPEVIPTSLVDLWKTCTSQNRDPDDDKLSKILDDVLKCFAGENIFLVFDALDECPDRSIYGRKSLFKFLTGMMTRDERVHILATSRYEEDIRLELKEQPTIDLEKRMNKDVETFINHTLDNGKFKGMKLVKDRISKKLLEMPERRFRWAHLQIQDLERCKNEKQIDAALKSVPRNLEETYLTILQKIPSEDQDDVRLILTWLCFSLQALKLKTVANLVSYLDPHDVIKVCTTSLVRFSVSDETVTLAHFSVKEYLIAQHATERSHWCQLTPIDGHCTIANGSLDCLLNQTKLLTKKAADAVPLFNYAADNWHLHVLELGDADAQLTKLEEKMYRLFEEQTVYLNWQRRDEYEWRMGYAEVKPPLWVASKAGIMRVVEKLLSQGAKPLAASGHYSNDTAIDASADNGHLTVLKLLLEEVDISVDIASRIAQRINHKNASHDVFIAILDIILTTDVFNNRSQNEVLVLPEEFLVSVAKNKHSGSRLMIHLLCGQDKLKVFVTEKVLKAVVENREEGEAIMRLIYETRREDIQITLGLAQTIAHWCDLRPGTSTLILQTSGDQMPLDENIITLFAKNASLEMMKFLLHIRGHDILITEGVLYGAGKKNQDAGVFPLLWKIRLPGIEVNPKLLKAVTRGRGGAQHIELLLGDCDPGYVLEGALIQNVAANRYSGLGMMKMLLENRQAGLVSFDVSEAVVVAGASNERQMVELLLNNGISNIPLTESILRSAAANEECGDTIMQYFFELDETITITEAVLSSAAANRYRGERLLQFLFGKFPDAPVTDSLLNAACINGKALLLLLQRHYPLLQPRESIVKLIELGDIRAFALYTLIQQDLIELDEHLVESVAFSSDAIYTLHRLGPNFPVTQKALWMACENDDAITALLYPRKPDITPTEETLMTALDFPDAEGLRTLLVHTKPVVSCTDQVLEKAIHKDHLRAFDIFMEPRPDLNIKRGWEAIWRNDESSFEKKLISSNILLKYGELDVSQTLLEFVPRKYEEIGLSDRELEELVDMCIGREISVPAIQMLLPILFGRVDHGTIRRFIDRKPELHITGDLVQLVERNQNLQNEEKEELVALLNSKRASDQNVEISETEEEG